MRPISGGQTKTTTGHQTAGNKLQLLLAGFPSMFPEAIKLFLADRDLIHEYPGFTATKHVPRR